SATAYLTTRVNSKVTKFLLLMAIVSLAVPGLVLGLAYVIVFKKSFIYGTIAILIMVNTVHFFASPYLMLSFLKVNIRLLKCFHTSL
ncbi:MAG: phosphonate ABC transporter permease, partial [Bacilli bacterium]|nr:phosphonate ABC transporter permease [Bacilli bacterium]